MSGGADVTDKSLLIRPSVVVIAAALTTPAIKRLLFERRRTGAIRGQMGLTATDKGEVEEAVRDQIDGFSFSTSASVRNWALGGVPPGGVL